MPPENLAPDENPTTFPIALVFTTHTPVEAGHDCFSYERFEQLLPGVVDAVTLKKLARADDLRMTRLALSLSDYVNGLALRRARTTEQMFPGYHIHAITNGVHALDTSEVCREVSRCHKPEVLIRASQLPEETLEECHRAAKADLIGLIHAATGTAPSSDVLTIGFGKRMTGYKRPLFLFSDLERLLALTDKQPVQVVLLARRIPTIPRARTPFGVSMSGCVSRSRFNRHIGTARNAMPSRSLYPSAE